MHQQAHQHNHTSCKWSQTVPRPVKPPSHHRGGLAPSKRSRTTLTSSSDSSRDKWDMKGCSMSRALSITSPSQPPPASPTRGQEGGLGSWPLLEVTGDCSASWARVRWVSWNASDSMFIMRWWLAGGMLLLLLVSLICLHTASRFTFLVTLYTPPTPTSGKNKNSSTCLQTTPHPLHPL